MPDTRFHDPHLTTGDSIEGFADGLGPLEFNASGVATTATPDDYIRKIGLKEVGVPGLDYASIAGNASRTITVPTGKVWRVVGHNIVIVTDATVANRDIVVALRDSADVAIETLTHSSVTASLTVAKHGLYGSSGFVVGNLDVAAAGTLTMDTNPTAADTMTLNATAFTFVASLTGAVNEILIGTDLAATKVSVENAVGATPSGTAADHSVSDAVRTTIAMSGGDFSADAMIFTADELGTVGNALATTETFTAGTNVFDAATLGTTTAGVDAALVISAEDWPEDQGPLLVATEDINISTTAGVAGDTLYVFVSYVEFDLVPSAQS